MEDEDFLLLSHGDGAAALSLIRQTGEAGDRTCDSWFTLQVKWFIHYTTGAPE